MRAEYQIEMAAQITAPSRPAPICPHGSGWPSSSVRRAEKAWVVGRMRDSGWSAAGMASTDRPVSSGRPGMPVDYRRISWSDVV
jgi:hypothetical protein